MRVPAESAVWRRGWFRWSWERRDAHRSLTAFALIGVSIAAAMAVCGLPPVDLHGPLHYLGVMDPLCGGTRAAWYTARGEWRRAWTYNPLGILAVVGAAAVTGRAVVGLLARRWLTFDVTWTPRRRRLLTIGALVLLAILEVRQQLQAALLMSTP